MRIMPNLVQAFVSTSLLSSLCWGFENPAQQVVGIQIKSQRPIYLIAHRVLHTTAIPIALRDGANAFEMDVAPYGGKLYAYHDDIGPGGKPGHTVEEMLDTFAQHANETNFVWFDIKKPNTWASKGTSIEKLQRMVQEKLEPVGIRALYGFSMKDTGLEEFDKLAKSLSGNEAISIGGRNGPVGRTFDSVSSDKLSVKQKVMDYGISFLNLPYAMDCDWPRDKEDVIYPTGVCYELYQGAKLLRDRQPRKPKVGMTFGWTIRANDEGTNRVDKLLGFAKADGLIYGEATHDYRDSPDIRVAIGLIQSWLDQHSETHRRATKSDVPW
ncbi:hypothetical protein PENCOP_c001G02505 [Penicillium coprophilum]|uniref:GP-PDE domain-containing protein n=1 Tax=Penicillium coprophilum TaxID=36646 RepID=A0A1V6V8Q0_9EURO|nr:hypothetical protein PENCOP_c001G02505 [Penicillium coprophilum]